MQYSTNGIIIAKGSTHQALTPLSTHHQAGFSKNEKTQCFLCNVILSLFRVSFFITFKDILMKVHSMDSMDGWQHRDLHRCACYSCQEH